MYIYILWLYDNDISRDILRYYVHIYTAACVWEYVYWPSLTTVHSDKYGERVFPDVVAVVLIKTEPPKAG